MIKSKYSKQNIAVRLVHAGGSQHVFVSQIEVYPHNDLDTHLYADSFGWGNYGFSSMQTSLSIALEVCSNKLCARLLSDHLYYDIIVNLDPDKNHLIYLNKNLIKSTVNKLEKAYGLH